MEDLGSEMLAKQKGIFLDFPLLNEVDIDLVY